MAYDIRLPNITAATEKGQLEQMRSYLYQFAEQLKYAVDIIDSNTLVMSSQVQSVVGAVESPSDEQKQKQFANLKNLIISSADIVNAYTEKITYELQGNYEALSPDFGRYWEETRRTVEETAKNQTDYYDILQNVNEWTQHTKGYIRSGELGEDENGNPILGIEVGVFTTKDDGTEDNKGYSRFTSNETIFYNGQNQVMAVLSGQELIIENIVCKGVFYIGNFMIDTLHGFSIRHLGRQVT
jgi:hypothetical protein